MRKKRILIGLICVLFTACIVLSLCLLFAIRQVNIIFEASAYTDKDLETINDILSTYEGKSLVTLKSEEVEGKLSIFTYLEVESVKKEYPNKLTVSLKERKEVYSVKKDDKYFMLSDEGYVLSAQDENKNNIDDVANVLLSGFTVKTAIVGKTAEFEEQEYFEILKSFAKGFTKIRDLVYAVDIKTEHKRGDFIFNLYTGASLVIEDAFTLADEKLKTGLDFLDRLDDYSKTEGYIRVYKDSATGAPKAVWTRSYE